MKNFTLIEAPASRQERLLLIHLSPNIPDNEREFKPFSYFVKHMGSYKGYSENTIQLYAECVASFLDFVFEASLTSYARSQSVEISDVIYSYEQFMLYGKDSEHPLSNELAHRLNKDRITSIKSLSQPIDASIKLYLTLCQLRAESDYIDPLFGRLVGKTPEFLSSSEKSKIKKNSWLAGTVRGSLERAVPRKGKIFAGVARRNKGIDTQPYVIKPLDIENAVSVLRVKKPARARRFYRDMAIYSLMLATGCRSHEALQIRFSDLKIDEDGDVCIELHSPFLRSNVGLTPKETKKLSWKTRQSPTTFLLYPFIDIFSEYLKLYLEKEYLSEVNHDFIFQKENGRPLFASDRKSLNSTFKGYLSLAGIAIEPGLCRHSLRHTYGTYILNYMPVPGNSTPGLPMHFVKIILGHASISSTQKYAKHDQEILNTYIQHANNYLRNRGERSVERTRLEFHQRQIHKIQALIQSIYGTA